jgi:quercetin dioxygenase-like cupin family protein
MYFLQKDCPLVDVGNGVSRRVLAHAGTMMQVEWHFGDGCVGYIHQHPHEQLTYVLSGEFEFTIGDDIKIVKAGDTMYKEPNIMHGCTCLKAGVLIDTFTPQRDDLKAG